MVPTNTLDSMCSTKAIVSLAACEGQGKRRSRGKQALISIEYQHCNPKQCCLPVPGPSVVPDILRFIRGNEYIGICRE